jgi:hypothetical protein
LMIDLFSKLDSDQKSIVEAKFKKLGISDEDIASSLEDMLSGKPEDPPIKQRLPKKQERVVNAWRIPAPDGSSLLFETQDGIFWQLCDVGLGWSRYNKPDPSWSKQAEIQRHLPATMIPRPRNSAPWSYDLQLDNRMVLCIRPHAKGFGWQLRRKTLTA